MKRVLSAVCGVVILVSGSAGVPAHAEEPWGPPVIISTGIGNTDTIPLAATSEAPYVLFRLSNESFFGPFLTAAPVAPDPDGVFRASLPSRGLNRTSWATALNCTTAAVESCTSESRSEPVQARHAHVTIQLSREANPDQVIDPPLDKLRVVVPDLGDDEVWLDLVRLKLPVPIRRLQQIGPGEHEVNLPVVLPPTDYAIWLSRCSEVNPSVCDWPSAFQVKAIPSLFLRNTVDPRLKETDWGLTGYLNQNGDGFAERTRFTFLPGKVPIDAAWWRVTDSAGKTVLGPRRLTPAALAGTESIVIDPRAAGRRLRDGHHDIRVIADGVLSGHRVRGEIKQGIVVWNSRSLRGVRTNLTTVYPVKDGYRDTIRISPKFVVKYLRSLKIVRADGTVVRTFDKLPIARSWGGRLANGKLAPAGRYRMVLGLVAPNLEADTFRTPLFSLSHRRPVVRR